MNADPSIEAVLPNLKVRRKAAMERIRADQQEVRLLDLAIEGLEGLVPSGNGDGPTQADSNVPVRTGISVNGHRQPSPPDKPRTIRAIDAIAQAIRSSVEGLTLPELTAAVADLGFRPETDQPERAVRASANRLRDRDENYDFVDKRYVYLPDHRDLPSEPQHALVEEVR